MMLSSVKEMEKPYSMSVPDTHRTTPICYGS